MAPQDVNIRNWADMEGVLLKTFTNAFRDVNKDEKGAGGVQQNFTSILEQHKAALVENTEKIQSLTQAIQNLSGGIGGGGGRPSSNINAQTPQEGQLGAKPPMFQRMLQGVGIPIGGRGGQRDSIFAGSEDNPVFDFFARQMLIRGGISSALATGSQLMPQNIARNFYAGAQRLVEPYVTQPTELGMLTGATGPGYEPFSQMGSSFGSLVSGRMAFPSMVFSGGTNPNMLGGSLFGTEMSPAQSEGFKTRYRAFTRSLNPFDMLSYERALEINQGVSQAGFRNLGERVSVEEAVTQIVQTTAIDASSAIDMLSLSVKQLKADVKDSADMIKEFGPAARMAGKSVQDYAKESSQAAFSAFQGGALGTSGMRAGQIAASFTGIDASMVQGVLNSSDMTGLFAAGIMGGGPGGQFNNPDDILALALDMPYAMGGGQKADEVEEERIKMLVKTVDDMTQRTGGNKDRALMLVAGMMNKPLPAVREMYNQAPKVLAQAQVRREIGKVGEGYQAYYGGTGRRGANATSATGKKAFRRFRELSQEGATDWGFESLSEGGIPGIPMFRERGGLNFENINIGGKSPEFEEKVKDIYDARMSGDQEALKKAIEAAEGTDAERAASLLMTAGQSSGAKAEQAWKTLNQNYGISFEGPGVTWDSTKGGIPKGVRDALKGEFTRALSSYRERGAITEEQRKRIQEKVNENKLDPKGFKQEVLSAMEKKTEKENKIEVGLSEDAKKWFNIFNKAANSSQGKFVMVAPPGVDNRATPNPGGP